MVGNIKMDDNMHEWINGQNGKEFKVECSETCQVGLAEYDHFWVELMGNKKEYGSYYSGRIIEDHLIDEAVYIKERTGCVVLCVPCGKHRVSGLFDLEEGMFEEKEVIEILSKNDGFPNPRVESYPKGDGEFINFLVWGKTPRARDSEGNVPHDKLGTDLGYKKSKIEDFCKRMNYKTGI